MSERQDFDFDGESAPEAYDSILVPVLFEPWAEMLLQRLPPQRGWSVLDLATGIVTSGDSLCSTPATWMSDRQHVYKTD